MSLINQMLRDLEQRNNQNPKSAQPLNVRIADKPARGKRLLWLLPLMALPAAYLWYQAQPGRPAPQPAAPVDAAVIAVPEPAVERNQSQPPASPPPGERIESTALPISTVPTPNASLAEPQQPASEHSIVNKPPQAVAKSQVAVPKQAEATPPPPAERSRNPSPASMPIERPKTAKASTPGERAEALYRQAQHSASALMTQENLKEALQLDPHYLPARTLLLQTLLKSHADAELGEFVDDSLQLFPGNLLFIKTRAHLYVQQKNFAAAVNILERIDADTVDDGAYLALLAAGYQQLQRFPQAARIYRQLTQIQPDKAEHWLGLAIAQDKLNQSQSAVQAYRQALDKKTLNAEVVSYIKQRLSVLTPAL